MWTTIVFWLLTGITFGTYFWLIWDIAHWLPKDFVNPTKEEE